MVLYSSFRLRQGKFWTGLLKLFIVISAKFIKIMTRNPRNTRHGTRSTPNCTINFEGASGRSIGKLIYDLCWIWRQFVLRPSKGGMFAKVSRWKLPCKRRRMCRTHTVTCGLWEYKKKMRGQKLPDGKNVGVAGRLTDDVIDRMQSNYREAIRNNSEIGTMKTAIILI